MTRDQIILAKKRYPDLIRLMKSFHPGDVNYKTMLKHFVRFLNFKNKMSDKEFYEKYIRKHYKTETIKSPSFGTKTFYKTNTEVLYWDIFITL